MGLSVSCPNCGSKTVRSRQSVYESGTSIYRGRHSNSGMSFSIGKNFKPRFYTGGGRHSGTRQSLIAQRAAPVPVIIGFPIVILVYFFTSGSVQITIASAIAWAAFAILMNRNSYDKEWICSKCGAMFDPDKTKLYAISSEISKLLQEIKYGKNKQEIGKKASRVIDLMNELEVNGFHHTVSDFHELKNKMSVLLKISDAADLLDKADKAHFMKNKKQEINFLLEALYSLRSHQTTVREFDSYGLKSEITGEIWTVNLIKKKLLQAGYNPPKKGN